MKVYLDEDLSPAIARVLREKGIDATSAHEVVLIGVSDREQLDHAAREGRALVSRNARHLKALAADRVRRQDPHAGIIVCPPTIKGSEYGAIARAIRRLAADYPSGLGPYDLVYLPKL